MLLNDVKIEIDKSFIDEVRKKLIDNVVERCIAQLLRNNITDWDKSRAYEHNAIANILNKINWQKAVPELQTAIVQKFFEKLIDKHQ